MEVNIVGKWNKRVEIMGEVQLDMTYEFRVDGTYSYINAVTGVRTDGHYEMSGDRIIFPGINDTRKFELKDNTLSIDFGSSAPTLYFGRK